jgi:4-amino-4-deoxy-L-arabinose transferase-like glycosyltransferase
LDPNKLSRRDWLILAAIFILALLVRIWGITSPPLNQDEAMYAYDAYSLGLTGKDSWGVTLPVRPECFGEYCYPLLDYAAIPSVMIFGPTELGIRLPVAILNALIPLIVALAALKITRNRPAAFGAGILAALSPTLVLISRIGWYASLPQVFTAAALMFGALSAFRLRNVAITGLLAALGYYAYPTAGLFAATVILPIILLRAFQERKLLHAGFFVLCFVAFSAPLIYFSLSNPSLDSFHREQVVITNPDSYYNPGHEQWFPGILVRHYLSYLDPSYLANPYKEYFDFGLSQSPFGPFLATFLSLPLALLVALFFFAAASMLDPKRVGNVNPGHAAVALWLALGMLSSVLMFPAAQSYRTNVWFPAFFVAAAMGFDFVCRHSRKIAYALLALALAIEVLSLPAMQQSFECAGLFSAGAGWEKAAKLDLGSSQTWILPYHPVHIYSFVYQKQDPGKVQSVLSSINRSRPSWFALDSLGEMQYCSTTDCQPTGDYIVSSSPVAGATQTIYWCGRPALYVARNSR